MTNKMSGTLCSILLIAGMLAVASLGTFSYFNDTETSTGNMFTAGTLDLKVDGKDDPDVVHIEVDNIYPGWSKQYTWTLKNIGTLPGKVTVTFSTITNNDNGLMEPESKVDSTGGDGEGELGEYLRTCMVVSYFSGGTKTCLGRQSLNNIGGTTVSIPEGNYGQSPLLNENESHKLMITFELPSDIGNIVQSDSVEFNITFRLEQVL